MAKPTTTSPLNSPSHSELHNFHVNVKMYNAVGDGTTDDTTAFTSAIAAAGAGGTVYIPAGTYRVNNILPAYGQVLAGAGTASGSGGTILKAATGATQVIGLSTAAGGILNCRIRDMKIDGNSLASVGVQIGGGLIAGGLNTQGHQFNGVHFLNCSTGVRVGSGDAQCDKNQYISCVFESCTTGLHIDSLNGHEQGLFGTTFNSCGTGIKLSGGSFAWVAGQVQTATTAGVVIDSARGYSQIAHMTDVQFEGETITVDGSTGWPLQGVHLNGCISNPGTSDGVKMGVDGVYLYSNGTSWNIGQIKCTASNCTFVDIGSTYAGGAAWTNTGGANNRFRLSYSSVTGWQGSDSAAAVSLIDGQAMKLNTAGTASIFGDGSAFLWLTSPLLKMISTGAAIEFVENGTNDASAGGVNTGRLYVKDNGAGKTQLCVRFNTGAVQVLATEP